ncbi:MAG: hypothetical protein KFH87_13255 [Bacteroidetes bacterium]|nr:hypothetical protein [Bacteroidota bacterium]
MNTNSTLLAESNFVKRMQLIGVIATAVGIILSIIGMMIDMQRFLFDYLIAFVFWGGIAVTSVFFSMLQFLTRSGWSVAVRRIPELTGGFTPLLFILVLPIVFGVGELYHHWVHPEPGDVILAGKQSWLNVPFFIVRLFVYVGIWVLMYFVIVGNSFKQDTRNDITPTRRNWMFSAPITILYGITITFAAFDLLMSLYPHWFSTIYGVYYFSGSLVGALAVITIIAVSLRRAGLLTDWLTSDRMHDLGKLLFAFNIFWAYIAFSQYILIWYADLPEEIVFFTYRSEHGWEVVSLLLLLIHFIVPFFLLLSEDTKRNMNTLLAGAVILLFAHLLDMYWLVMPYYDHDTVTLGWMEFAPLTALGGLFLLATARQFRRHHAIPLNDPFLAEAGGTQ